MSRLATVTAAAVATGLVLAACGGGKSQPAASSSATVSAPPSSAATSGGLAGDGDGSTARSTIVTTPSAKLSTGAAAAEHDGTCPYISDADFQEFEGDRVGRVTVLETKPVGCRFYFSYQPDQIIGEVRAQDFADTKTAFNSMVASAKGHPEVQSNANLDGVAAVAYQTSLQGELTWQCLVTVGRRVYTVRTRQVSPAQDAFNLAAALVRTVT